MVYPTVYGLVRKHFPQEARAMPSWLKSALKKYGILFFFCIITAIVVVAVYRQSSEANLPFWKAILLGFGFEATVEKLFFPHTASKRKA